MFKRLLRALLGSNQPSDGQSLEEVRREVYGDPWEWERADEYPFDNYYEAVETIKQLKRERRHDEVIELLRWCIDFTEAEARAENTIPGKPAPAYYRHLGIVLRKEGRHQDEVELLDHYLDVCEELGEEPDEDLVDRLEKARENAAD